MRIELLLPKKRRSAFNFFPLFLIKIVVGLLIVSHTTPAQYRFDSFTTDNGLPQNSGRAIAQTPDGYLWLTTFDGLVRYDGAKFTVFDKNNSEGISSNRFTCLHVDGDGVLFAGTEDGGLVVYRDGKFRSFTVEDGLPSNVVTIFRQDRRGEIAISTALGSCYFRDGKLVPVPESDLFGRGGFYAVGTGTTWQLDKTGVHQTTSDGREIFYPLKTEFMNEAYGGLLEFEDRAGNLWFGDRAGVYRLRNGEVTKFGVAEGVPPRTILRPFVEEDDGSIWFASSLLAGIEGVGLARYKDGKFTTWDRSSGLASNLIVQVFRDREGTIWLVSGDRGLMHVQKQVIASLSTGNGLIYGEVYPLLQTRRGDIYVGTQAGLSRFSDGKFSEEAVRSAEGDAVAVTALREDERGDVWVGENNDLFPLRNSSARRIKLGDNAIVFAIYCDSGNVIWAGTSKGLFKLKDEQVVGHLTMQDGLPGDDIKFIHKDTGGALWLGTYGGLSRFKDGNFTNYTVKDGLASDRVRTIYEDEHGTLWIGTYDGGLSRFADGRFFNFTVDNGLFNNGVFQIFDDDRGNFWMSSNRGISRVNRQELEDVAAGRAAKINSVAYGKTDGMFNSECNGGRQPAGIKTADGKLWFPTMDGVAIVDPRETDYNSQPPPVRIESVLIERAAADFHGGITLAANDNNVEIRYTGISFIKPEQIKFRYRIEGLDENWTDVGTIREVYFPSLPPGKFKFRVIAANSDGVWNEEGAVVAINVLPPFWETRWFLSVVLIGVGVLVFGGYKVRTTQLTNERKRQEAFSRRLIDLQENERKRIAGELHDSLSQNLVIIKNRAAISLQERHQPEQAFEQLEEIADAASESLSEVREIAHNLRPFQIDRLGLTKAIEALVRKTNTPDLSVAAELDKIDDAFPPEMEINLYRIVQESLSNIIKHAAATEARVTIAKIGKSVEITIKDNGKGFDTSLTRLGESNDGSGFGLIGITERARILGTVPVIESTPFQGTKIFLKVDIKL